MTETAKGIVFLSGAGGSGRTASALGSAISMARYGQKTLLIDFCFGTGGLNIVGGAIPDYHQIFQADNGLEELVTNTGMGFDLLTCNPPDVLNPGRRDLENLVRSIHGLGRKYGVMVIDPPAGNHPLAMAAADLCEEIFLLIKPEASAVASSYCLLKSLALEGLAERVKAVFGFVNSPEHALSFKERFDILTGQFLGMKVGNGGYTYRRTEREYEEFVIDNNAAEFISFVKNISLNRSGVLHSETDPETGIELLPISGSAGR